MYKPVRGTRDLFGEEYKKHLDLLAIARKISKRYGYQHIETPIFEFLSVFSKTLGETTDIIGKEMYIFQDKNDENLVLRPEGTASTIRAFLSNGLSQNLPQKLFYYGPMFRYERPQKGRYRQFYQIGVEHIGIHAPIVDAETIALAYFILNEMSIDSTLQINTLGSIQDRQNYKLILHSYFSKYKNDLSDNSQRRLEDNPLRILDSKCVNDQKIAQDAPKIELDTITHNFFENVLKFLEHMSIPYQINNKLVRGLDYYEHTIFEFQSENLGAQNTVLGGGRYNGLVKQMGGNDIPGIGWALGLDRACLLSKYLPNDLELKIAVIPIDENDLEYGLKVATSLRLQTNCTVEFLYSNSTLKKKMKTANALNANFCCIVGENESNNQVVQIKYFGKQVQIEKNHTIPFDNVHLFFQNLYQK